MIDVATFNNVELVNWLKDLSARNATGLLTVKSRMGEKQIGFHEGLVSVFSDKKSERMRIGDVLLARKVISEEQLQEALAFQKKSTAHARLGEVLFHLGHIEEDDITNAVKFQIQEELLDLFTWKDAEVSFDEGITPDDLEERGDLAKGNAHVLDLNPVELIEEAASRIDEWKIIEERLFSPYLFFEATEVGKQKYKGAVPKVKRMIKMIMEGRSLEVLIKRSCLGRFDANLFIISLLDEHWITTYPSSRLPDLAQRHMMDEHYADALHVYRRLIESARSEDDIERLEAKIADAERRLGRQQEKGPSNQQTTTGAPSGASRKMRAVERAINRQRLVKVAIAAVGVIIVAVITLFVISSNN